MAINVMEMQFLSSFLFDKIEHIEMKNKKLDACVCMSVKPLHSCSRHMTYSSNSMFCLTPVLEKISLVLIRIISNILMVFN